MVTLTNRDFKVFTPENLAFAGLCLIFYLYSIVPYGLGVTDDSVNYLAAAISFPESLTKVDGSPFIEWPPLFPLLLAGYKFFNLSPLTFSAILHGLSIFFSVILACFMLDQLIKSRKIIYLSKSAILFSTPLLLVHVFIWSEGLFILFFLLSLYFLIRYLNKESLISFALLTLTSSIMSFQRKSGIIIDTGIAISLALLITGSVKKRWLLSFSYLFLSILPFFVYLKTRFSTSGNIFTKASFDISRIGRNLKETVEILSSWFLPDEINLPVRVLLISLLITTFLLFYIKIKPDLKANSKRLLVSLIVILTVYCISIPVIFLYLELDQPFDDRIFAPVYIPGIILFFKVADFFYLYLGALNGKYSKLLKQLFFASILIWLVYPTFRTLYHLKKWHKQGVGGYNTAYWRENQAWEWLSNSHYPVYSNNLFPVFYFLKIKENQQVEILQEEELKNSSYLYICFGACHETSGKLKFESEDSKIFLIEREDNVTKRRNTEEF